VRSLALVVAALSSAACNRGGIIPPTRVDLAPVTMNRGNGLETGAHVAAGLHWASLYPRPDNPVDVGLGYAYDGFESPESRSPVAGPRPQSTGPASADPDAIHSVYIAAERRIAGSEHQRTWVGGRGEIGFGAANGHTRMGTGLTGRLGWEIFAGTKKHTRDILGVVAVGFFVEAGLRKLPGGKRAAVTSAGISVRLPLIVAR
jgi:hypothetical protein